MFRKKRIYLDYAASTPVDSRVLREMRSTLKHYANPSSIHLEGVKAQKVLSQARTRIARLAQVKSQEIIFTGSGTESNNLVLQGVVRGYQGSETPHIVTSSVEHPAILEVCRSLEKRGEAEVTYVHVDEEGLVSVEDVKKSLKENTVLVSIMQVNNEIGTIQPISQISKTVKSFREEHNAQYPYMHTDASQAPCYLDFHAGRLGVDMITIDSLKVYGPKGVGLLVKKENVTLSPLMYGGGQEKGLRSGTENVAGIVGLTKALEIAAQEREVEVVKQTEFRDFLISEIQKIYPKATLNGSKEKRVANNVNMCFANIDTEFLVITLDQKGIATSFSSSCRSRAENATSYVVEALGRKECAESSLRITFGRYTDKKELRYFLKILEESLAFVVSSDS